MLQMQRNKFTLHQRGEDVQMATGDQLYLRRLILLHVRMNNKTSFCAMSPHGKPRCPYSYTNKAEGDVGASVSP